MKNLSRFTWLCILVFGLGLSLSTTQHAYAQRVPTRTNTETRPNGTNSNSSTNTGNWQDPTAGSTRKGRFFMDGNLGFNFGNGGINVDVSPLLGYFLTNRIAFGAGPSFQYYKPSNNLSAITVYGGRSFIRYNVWQSLFAQVELAGLNYKNLSTNSRDWLFQLPVGGGISQRIVGNTSLNAMILYDVLYNADKSPYDNALIIRGGVNVGF